MRLLISTGASRHKRRGAPAAAGGGGDTVLAQAAAALGSNSWGSISTTGLTQNLITGGGNDSIFSWGRKCYWDTIDGAEQGRFYYFGISHSGAEPTMLSRIIRYDEATNAWSIEEDGPEADPGSVTDQSGNHSYDHFAYRPSDAQLFIRRSKTERVFRRARGATTWTELATLNGTPFWHYATADALHYHPGLNGGSGGLVFVGYGSVQVSNAAFSSWTTVKDTLGHVGEVSFQTCTNGADSNAVYFGGGSSSAAFWKVNADGTVTQKANSPVSDYGNAPSGSGGGSGTLLQGVGSNKPFMIRNSDGAIFEYDHVGNSWGSQVTTLPFSPSQEIFIACPIHTYGVVAFAWISGGQTPSSTMYLWKR